MAYSYQSGSSSGFSSSTSQSGEQQLPGAAGYYQDLLNRNSQNYKSILDAYGGGINKAQGSLPGIYSGFGQIQQGVMKTLGLGGGGWGVATPAAQAIQRSFEQTQGQNQQNLINAGLGNTTVLANQQTGAARQAGEAYGALGAQLAQTAAGYQSQLGLAGLQSRMQGLGLQTGLASQLGNALAGYRFQNTFGNLYGQYSTGQSHSQNSSVNSGSSYGPSGGGGGGYGGGSNAGFADPSQLAINPYGGYGSFLGGSPSGYYGTGAGYGSPGLPAGANVIGGGSIDAIDPNLFGAY